MSLSLQHKKSSNSTKSNKIINHNQKNQYFKTQTIGNQIIQKLIKSGIIQPKLKISQPDDPYEREADRVADQIMRMSIPQEKKIQRKNCSSCQMKDDKKKEDELKISRKPSSNNSNLTASSEISNQIMNTSGGRPLDSSTQSFMESRFNHDFSNVRIHDNSKSNELSRSINARAFTVGNNIFLGKNESILNKRLMAHELTHVMQQRSSEIILRQEGIPFPPGYNEYPIEICYCGKEYHTVQEKRKNYGKHSRNTIIAISGITVGMGLSGAIASGVSAASISGVLRFIGKSVLPIEGSVVGSTLKGASAGASLMGLIELQEESRKEYRQSQLDYYACLRHCGITHDENLEGLQIRKSTKPKK